MENLETIRSAIGNFAGYESEDARRIADEQIRAFVGERLAALPADTLEALSATDRAAYDRILLRCEFINQGAFADFEHDPTPERIAALLAADAELITSIQDFPRLEAAFDKRDAVMQSR
jgi:hypothetical protein